jgi:putative glutamine amidotransferase
MRDKPRIAVILDENTSGDASRYEASKGYFKAIGNAGGLPFGVPYLPEVIGVVVEEFEGLLCVGGRFAYPDNWYLPGKTSKAPLSERFEVERAIVEGFLRNDKPILGICAGMQLLAGIQGCRLWSDVRASSPQYPGARQGRPPVPRHRGTQNQARCLGSAANPPRQHVPSRSDRRTDPVGRR